MAKFIMYENLLTFISRVLDQNGISKACYIVEIYHSSLKPSNSVFKPLTIIIIVNIMYHTPRF